MFMKIQGDTVGARNMRGLSRRVFLVGGAAAFLAACQSSQRFATTTRYLPSPPRFGGDPAYRAMYAAIDTEPFPIPAVDIGRIPPQFYRQQVAVPYSLPSKPGTIVVDPGDRFLYLVQEDGKALRYGIGVGREGFGWNGGATVGSKQQWPKWFPPKEMVERDPKAAPYANGMDGGINNPLGARALYLYQGKKDTLFRIHGTNEPWSIGQAVSSGCIRMLNQDVIDLYDRVPIGTSVVVLATAGAPLAAGPEEVEEEIRG
jgi:lipoprotein-anchoring transpeptidase ErfK/SrfK